MTQTVIEKDQFIHAKDNAHGWIHSIEEMLIAVSDESNKDALQAIHESVLSVMVRDGWYQPGRPNEYGPEEYEILLSTGGPALRIYGKLGRDDEPETAELQMQDWFLPWQRYPTAEEPLLQFARYFYFGG